jgi:hypothetical protein
MTPGRRQNYQISPLGRFRFGPFARCDPDQVLHGKHRAMPIVDLQAEQPWRSQTAARDHDRHFPGVILQLCIAKASGEDDDPVDTTRYKFPHAPFFVLFAPIAAHEQRRVSALP